MISHPAAAGIHGAGSPWRTQLATDMNTSGVIFDLKKFALHDGPGIRTTIFFKGCPLSCWWCHNPEGLKADPEIFAAGEKGHSSASNGCREARVGCPATVRDLMAEVEKDVVFYDQSGGGVTLSGGEPLIQEEFVTAFLAACRAKGIHTALDTSGYAPWEMFDKIRDMVGLFLFDVKLADEEEHMKYTGVSNRLIFENLGALLERCRDVIVRIPLVPHITDTEVNLKAIIALLSHFNNVPGIDLLPYNKMGEEKFRRFSLDSKLGPLPAQTEEELRRKAGLFEDAGYDVNIGG
jgi:pyruvate formate lyase activating enzyme